MPIKKAASGVWCDNCKLQWGWVKEADGTSIPHPKGRRQAYSTIISETHHGKEPIVRSYCYQCIDEMSRWHDGTIWTLAEQIQYAKDNRPGQQIKIGGF